MTLALKITLTIFIESAMLGIVASHFWVESVSERSKKFFNVLVHLFSFIAMASLGGVFICIIWNIGR